MEEYSYFDENPKKGIGFIIALSGLFLFTIMGLGIDFDEYSQHESLQIPLGYFYVVFSLDFLMFLCIILLFFYKKIGLFGFPVFLIAHFFMHHFYLSTFLYSDMTNLFIYCGFGMVAIIPKWKFFK